MLSCKELAKTYNFKNKKDVINWILKNHPDKIQDKSLNKDFSEIIKCKNSSKHLRYSWCF